MREKHPINQRVSKRLGEQLPTMRLNQTQVAQFARHADARAREGRRITDPDIEVSVAYLDEVPTALRRSDVMPILRSAGGPSLQAVPVILVTRDDLAWFEFDADAHAVLAMVDGESTVADIVTSVAIPSERTLALLRDLELQRVIGL